MELWVQACECASLIDHIAVLLGLAAVHSNPLQASLPLVDMGLNGRHEVLLRYPDILICTGVDVMSFQESG
jgi:hypothetical protein